MSEQVQVIAMPDMNDKAVIALLTHGCVVEMLKECIRVIFPEDTTRYEILPRTTEERYMLRLPDGFLVMQQCARQSKMSILFYGRDEEQ